MGANVTYLSTQCDRVDSNLEWQAKPPIKVKGKDEHVDIFVPCITRRRLTRRLTASMRNSEVTMPTSSSDSGTVFREEKFSPMALARHRRALVPKQLFPEQCIVGRRREMSEVRTLFNPYLPAEDRVVGGPSVLLVEGQMGMGKTKLAEEATRIATFLDMSVVSSSADKMGASTMLHVFRDLMEALLDIEEEDLRKMRTIGTDTDLLVADVDQSVRMEALRDIFCREGDLDTSDSDSGSSDDSSEDEEDEESWMIQALPLLDGTILNSVQFDAGDLEQTARIDSQSRQNHIITLLDHWFQVAAEDSPLCVILDDAQYIDKTSWKLLRRISNINGIVIMLCLRSGEGITVADNEIVPMLANSRACHQVRLGPLEKDEVAALLCDKWGVATVSDEIVDVVFQKGAGNPFHSEQLGDSVRKQIDSSGRPLIRINDSHCELQPNVVLHNVKFPDGLQGLITQQLDKLPAEERKLVKRAAVVGFSASVQLLAAVLQHPAVLEIDGREQHSLNQVKDATVHLFKLQQKGLVQLQVGAPPDDGGGVSSPQEEIEAYTFTQRLTHEVAYELNTYEDRKRVHRATAEKLASLEDETCLHEGLSTIQVLADHWGKAGNVAEELQHLESAGEQALAMYANEDASQIFRSIIKKAAGGSGDQWETARQGLWRLKLGQAEIEMGHSAEAKQILQRALVLYSDGVWALPDAATMKQRVNAMASSPHEEHVPAGQAHCVELAMLHDRLSHIAYFNNDQYLRLYSCLLAHHFAQQTELLPEQSKGHALATIAFSALGQHTVAEQHCRTGISMAVGIEKSDPATALQVLVLTSLYVADRGLWQKAIDGWLQAVEIAERLCVHPPIRTRCPEALLTRHALIS
jgi:tetratricopeptide (TPR) repeat protein